MGGTTQQVCSEKAGDQFTSRKDMEKCKITDRKQSGNRITMTMSCPQGTMTVDQTFNAAHTEYQGTMKMTSRDGDMVMNMSGRKLGSCDAKQAQSERDAKMAAAVAQAKRSDAQSMALLAKQADDQIKECAEAVETMQVNKLGLYEHCSTHAEMCASQLKGEHSKRTATACMANAAEYCKRYQTMAGFTKAKGSEDGAATCKLSSAKLKASFCPQAAQTEDLVFLGSFCPVEAKPLALQHCAGRSYTSKKKDKYTSFCTSYLAKHGDLEEASDDKPTAQTPTAKAKEAVTEGVTQGINKLKGLFGK
jgi:hypothetical protein